MRKSYIQVSVLKNAENKGDFTWIIDPLNIESVFLFSVTRNIGEILQIVEKPQTYLPLRVFRQTCVPTPNICRKMKDDRKGATANLR